MSNKQATSTKQSGPSTSAGAWGLRGTWIFALIAGLLFATAALAQMPQSPWKKAAPFPEPDEELYGVAVNGKLYLYPHATSGALGAASDRSGWGLGQLSVDLHQNPTSTLP
jgi:hypothetical protein